jgi:hypothetical protein
MTRNVTFPTRGRPYSGAVLPLGKRAGFARSNPKPVGQEATNHRTRLDHEKHMNVRVAGFSVLNQPVIRDDLGPLPELVDQAPLAFGEPLAIDAASIEPGLAQRQCHRRTDAAGDRTGID